MITALVVMYNAERMLDDHFKSLWFCDEIIAIDIGSSDMSIDIAKKYNCKIEHHPWVPMGELAWVNYVKQSKYDWIIVSDPDEVVTPVLGGRIKYKIDHVSPTTGTVSLPYRHHFLGKRIITSMWKDIHYIPKLFHRDRVDLKCTVHSPFTIKSGYNNMWLKTELDDDSEVILHYPAENVLNLLKKLSRYAILEGESRFKKGEVWTVEGSLRSIARSIYYHFKSTHGLHTISGMFLGCTFVTYDILSQFSLWVYQRRYNNRYLEILQIEPTRRCNMNCKHCNRKDDTGNISIEDFTRILNRFPYVDTVKLQGLGEPLLHPQFKELLQICRDRGHKTMIITNGSLPIPEGIDAVVISLETLDHEKYESLRGYNLDRVITNICEVASHQKITINCVQTHLTTSKDVNDVKVFVKSIGADIWITPMEVWEDESHDDYSVSFDNVEIAHKIHGTSPNEERKLTCQWMKKYRYFDYLGREHPCCIRMTDEYILDNELNLNQCCKNCPT